MEVMIAFVIVDVATAVILNFGRVVNKSPYFDSGLEYINTQSFFHYYVT
jgi:hypothetical protein